MWSNEFTDSMRAASRQHQSFYIQLFRKTCQIGAILFLDFEGAHHQDGVCLTYFPLDFSSAIGRQFIHCPNFVTGADKDVFFR